MNGLWFWADVCEPGTGREKAKLLLNVDIWGIQGFHLIATVAMAPSVSLTVIIIMVTGGGRESWMSWQWLTSTWRPPSLSLALPQLCASSLHLVILLSHMECEGSSGAGGGGGGLYRLLLCQVYNAKCMFPGLCTHSCGLYVFTVNIPPWDVSNKPAGIIDTDVCVCVCVGCVFVCEVRWWVKGERLSSSVTRYHYLRHLLIITSPRLQRADDWIESAP